MDASVVVPTYMGADQLPRVLDALLHQRYGGTYDIIVVDDGSRDSTPDVLATWSQRYPDRIRTFRQPNAGPARARNRGAAEARGSFLAFIDDDCVAEPTWLAALHQAAEKHGAAAVAGTIINTERTWVGRYINLESVIDHVGASDGSVAQLITGNAGVRASVFRELGGFDEAIRVAGGEDTDFSLRLRQHGHRIAHATDARVVHPSHQTVADYLRMIHRHGRGRRRLGERFPEYRLSLPVLRLLWLAWPVRGWVLRDYRGYRAAGVTRADRIRYLALRYLENIVRVAGYLRGS